MAARDATTTPERPRSLIGTPDVDVLADVMRVVRITAGVYFEAAFPGPWAVRVADGAWIAARLRLPPNGLMVFHLLEQGNAWVDVGEDSVELHEHDLVVLPYSDQHVIRTAHGLTPMPTEAVMRYAVREHGVIRIRPTGKGRITSVICGFFHCDASLFNPLVRGLPPFVHLSASDEAGVLHATAEIIAHETHASSSGSATILSRLCEVLIVEGLRRYVQSCPNRCAWLTAVADPLVGQALMLLHGDPAQEWSVDALARAVGASRSSLAERFRALLGESPIAYLTSWRLQLAADRLTHGDATIATIADAVGYGSEAAFARAFKRQTGQSPASWRLSRVTNPQAL